MADGNSHSREVAESNAGLRALAGSVKLGANGLAATNLAELMDFAQLMAKAGPMVGKTFRGNPGACLGIAMQAMQWNMNPFAVSQKAYTTGDNIGYEGQLVIAVINAHAPIKERLRPSYSGEGAKRRCTISATIKGETEPCVYESPEVGQIAVKNSPLWKTDQDQQLFYYSSRMWARRYCPEVIMGVYDVDELAAVETTVVENSYAEDDSFIRGAEKDALVEDWNARLRACEDLDDIDNIMAEAAEKKSRLSRNTWDGLEHVAAEESERIKAGVAPKPPAPSPFEELKAQGLAVIGIENEAERLAAHGKWLSRVNARSLIALMSVSERDEIKTLKKTIKGELEQNVAGAGPGSPATEGAPV